MNPKTKQLLDAFCARPFTSLLLLGPAERGTEYCLKYIQETLLDADTRNNLIRIEPQLPKALSVEQIRDLKTSLATKSNRKGNTVTRIVYVSGFHTATVEAQNALLKVLEEPTEATVIILQADERESILQTIQSRCHIIPVLPLTKEQVLQEIITSNRQEHELQKILSLSGGDALTVRQMLSDNEEINIRVDKAKQFLSLSVFDRLLEQKEYESNASILELLASLNLVAQAGFHLSDKKQIDRWKNVLVELREIEDLCRKNVLPKIVYMRLCSSL
jgi:DNA polymerase III delta prime subunit